MFKVDDYKKISMNEGDFGIILPISFSDFLDGDRITVIIKDRKDENKRLLNKDFMVTDGKIDFVLTEEETDDIKQGSYLYDIRQHRKGELRNTIAIDNIFEVEEGI